jgi:hypothetical protein
MVKFKPLKFSDPLSFHTDFKEYYYPSKQVSGETYEGSYEILPSPEGGKIECAGKYMAEDLTIEPIPYYEVSNSDGVTVYIGEEITYAN